MGTPVDNAEEKVAKRSAIESTHNKTRADREAQYAADKVALQEAYQNDIRDIEQAKRDDLVAAGLNADGSDPQGRPTG